MRPAGASSADRLRSFAKIHNTVCSLPNRLAIRSRQKVFLGVTHLELGRKGIVRLRVPRRVPGFLCPLTKKFQQLKVRYEAFIRAKHSHLRAAVCEQKSTWTAGTMPEPALQPPSFNYVNYS